MLRADIHTLFDCSLIGVDPDSRTVVLHERLRGSQYEAPHGRRIRGPGVDSEAASAKALRWHTDAFGLEVESGTVP